jgi:flavin reductase
MDTDTAQQRPHERQFDRATYLDAMSRAATGVNIVTTDGPAGRRGLTVSAMSSVAADGTTPRLLVCINRTGSACEAILKNGVFVVNILRDDQAGLSDLFAGRQEANGVERFSASGWPPMSSGAPRLVAPLAAFDCRVGEVRLVDTHYVIFGNVIDIFAADHGAPLIYAGRASSSPREARTSSLAA